MNEKIKNIVILRTDRIGEVLLSTVAADAIKKHYPKARITFVTSSYSRQIVEGRDNIDEVIIAETMHGKNRLGRALRLAILMKERKFDASIVLNPHRTLHLACFLAGIPRRLGYDRKWSFLLTEKIADERYMGEKHEIEYTMDLLRLLGIDEKAQSPRLPLNTQAENVIERILLSKDIDQDLPLVAIHPGSSNPAKIWSHERYGELIKRLKQEVPCNIVVLGSKTESVLTRNMIQEVGEEVIDLIGLLDIKELTALIRRTDLFISNDTGPMHMAAALDVPVIAIFGRNIPGVSPRRWRPWGDKHMVFHEDVACDPCYDTACPYGYKCMRMITVDMVFEAAKEMLKKSS